MIGRAGLDTIQTVPEFPLISALGCAVRIDTSSLSGEEAQGVSHAWADAAWAAADGLPAVHRTVTLSADGVTESRLAALSQSVTLSAIEARRGELWMLHAAAVADDQGRVVAVIGPSGRGKTTASRALGAAYGYVSDETVAIDSRGTVLPYRKPLSVIERAGAPKAQHAPSALGLRGLPDAPLNLAALVLLDRRPDGPDEPIIENCDLGDVIADLVEQTSYLADLEAPLQTIAAHAAAVGGIRRVVYREAETLPDALAPLFRNPQPVSVIVPESRVKDAAESSGVYRGAYLDALALEEPDRIALLLPTQYGGALLRVLGGIGPAIWRAADGVQSEDLVPIMIETFGMPSDIDAAVAVAAAVTQLEDDDVLVRHPSWRVRSDVAWTGRDDSFVALQLSRLVAPTPVAMEGTAALIWDVLTRATALNATELIERVAEASGVEPSDIDTDVRAFLASLKASALAEHIFL